MSQHHRTIPSFRLRRSLVAALTALALPAAIAGAQATNTVAISPYYYGSTYNYGFGDATNGCMFAPQSSSGAVSAGGTCVSPGPSGSLVTITSAASVDASGQLHARAIVDGKLPRVATSPQVPYGYSAGIKVDAMSDDFLQIHAVGAVMPAASLVFDVFLHGTAIATVTNPQGPAPGIGNPGQFQGDAAGAEGEYFAAVYTGQRTPGEGEGEDVTYNAHLVIVNGSTPGTQVAFGQIVIPFSALMFSGSDASLRTMQWLEAYAVADIDNIIPGDATPLPTTGETRFHADADFAHTAGLSNVRVFDANGNDISAQYDLRTSTQVFGVSAVPEPATVALTATGLILLVGVARRRRAV